MTTPKDERTLEQQFASELLKRARYVQGNQHPEGSDAHKAYKEGFEDALSMVYIDLTGTPKSKGMLHTHTTALAEEVERKVVELFLDFEMNKDCWVEHTDVVAIIRSTLTPDNNKT